MTVPQEQKVGTVADFKRLSPLMFKGIKKPLAAEQWLTDTMSLLEAANVPAVDQVKVVKVQLTHIARARLLSEEAKLQGPITWKQFSDGFYERFFPKIAKRQMEKEFSDLKQQNKTVDRYVTDFLRLSRFALAMIADEEDKVNHFQ